MDTGGTEPITVHKEIQDWLDQYSRMHTRVSYKTVLTLGIHLYRTCVNTY